MRALSWCSKSILRGLFPFACKGETFERIVPRGSHSLRKDGAWCLLMCFREAIIFVTPSGARAYTKNFADHIFSKKSRENWPHRTVLWNISTSNIGKFLTGSY